MTGNKAELVGLKGTLRSNDAMASRTSKKTTLHVQLTFAYFFAVFADYDVKMPNFAFYGVEPKQATAKFYFSF